MPNNSNKFQNELENNLTEKQLKFGLWFTINKPKLYTALIIGLIVFDSLLVAYNLYRWGDYLFFGYWNDQKLVASIAQPVSDAQSLRNLLGPKPISIEGNTYFVSGNKIDAVAWLRNTNPKHLAFFSYDFFVGGVKTETRNGFLLPEEAKTVAELGIKTGGGDVNFEITSIRWQRIDAHQIKDIPSYINERLNTNYSNFQFTSAYKLGLTEGSVSFKVENNSFFNLWQADFWVILKAGETPVGIERLALDKFMAGEIRDVDLRVSASVNPNGIELIPDVNVFDQKSFFK